MKWVGKSRSLSNDLKSVSDPGKRFKIIREAKNRISDFKGKFGFREVASNLYKAGALPEGAKGRKLLKQFEEGHRKYPSDSKLVTSLIKLLDINSEFAGVKDGEEAAAVAEPEQSTKKSKGEALVPKKSNSRVLSVKAINKTEFSHSFYLRYYPEDKSLIIQIYDDEPVPSSDKQKAEHGRYTGELWVPGMTAKYSGTDKTKYLPSEETVNL